MTRSRPITLLLAFGLAVALCAASSAETLKSQFSEAYDIAANGTVSVQNTNGSLEIVSWGGEQVVVEATKVVKTMGRERAEEAMEALEIDVTQSPDELIIKTIRPRQGDSGLMSWIFGRRVEASVSYRLKVPGVIGVRARTVNGNVTIESVAGRIDAQTTNGQIRISEARSSTSASTTNGSIRAEFVELDDREDMSFRTTNGGITLWVPADLACSVQASTVNGAVSTDFPVLVGGGRTSRKRLTGDINGGGSELSLRTVNGSIQLRKSSSDDSV